MKEQVLVEVGMNVYGSHLLLGIQKMTLDMEEVNILEDIMQEAQKKFQEAIKAKALKK